MSWFAFSPLLFCHQSHRCRIADHYEDPDKVTYSDIERDYWNLVKDATGEEVKVSGSARESERSDAIEIIALDGNTVHALRFRWSMATICRRTSTGH